MNFIVVAYYTNDALYPPYAVKLTESLQRLGLPYDITVIPPFKNWALAVGYKPTLIRSMLDRHTGKDVLYVDIDAAIKVHPALFDDFQHDIGVRLRPGQELSGGTLYFKNNENGKFILDHWIEEQSRYPEKSDQKTLQTVIDRREKSFSVCDLPHSYCCKFDESLKPEEGPVVIEHYMASRRVAKRR